MLVLVEFQIMSQQQPQFINEQQDGTNKEVFAIKK